MTKVKTKEKIGYGLYTIGDLIEHLQQTVKENEYLNMDSPVFISDYNMTGYKHEFDVLPTFSPYMQQAGVCLFHSLGEAPAPVVDKVEEDFEEEDVVYEQLDKVENL